MGKKIVRDRTAKMRAMKGPNLNGEQNVGRGIVAKWLTALTWTTN